MLRINLLPPYINERGQKRNFVIGWIAGVLVLIGVFIFALTNLNTTLDQKKHDLDEAKARLSEKQKLDTDIANEKANRKAIEDKQVFVANAKKYNDGWPEVFEMMRDVTTEKILLRSMALDAGQRKVLSLTGFAVDEPTIVRWWMELRNKTELFDQVSFSLPPKGFQPNKGQGNTTGNPFDAMGGYGGPGGPGGPGSMGRPMMGGAMGPGSGGRGGMGGPMGMGGFGGGGGGGNNVSVGPGEVEGKTGINFAAACVLKTPMAGGTATPSWGGAGGGGGGAPGGMGPGMMPGGMGPGMMPGGMGGGPSSGGVMGGGAPAGGGAGKNKSD